ALQAERRELRVELAVAIALVARERMPGMRGVHADLMRAARRDDDLDEGRDLPVALEQPEVAARGLTVGVDAHARLARRLLAHGERCLDGRGAFGPGPRYEREVALL